MDASRTENQYYPMTYTHADGQETDYDLQQIRYEDGRPPNYVLSESADNQGPGFDDARTRDAVSHEAAQAAMALNHPELSPAAEREMKPNEVILYQQRPDGDFDRVAYGEIGKNARSNVDIEMEQNDPELYQSLKQDQEPLQDQRPEFTELPRTLYTREEVERAVGDTLRAPEETHQQYQASLNEQWANLNGPAIERNGSAMERNSETDAEAEQAVRDQQQRNQEQTLQMNQHEQQHQQSY